MQSLRRHHLATLAVALLASPLTFSQTGPGGYPNKPIRIIVPLAAGSAVDAAARIVAQKMGQSMGQSFVIENQPARRA